MDDNIVPSRNYPFIPASECRLFVGVAGEVYIVHQPTGNAYMNQTALANLCETSTDLIQKLCNVSTTKPYPKQLQTLLGNVLISTTKVENLGSGSDFVCINSSQCWIVLNYAANFSRGHEDRQKAKLNLARIGEAGMAAFIYNQAGDSPRNNSKD